MTVWFSFIARFPHAWCVLIFLICLFVASPLVQGKSAQKERIVLPDLEEVLVTATRYEEELAFVPANVTVLNEADIEGSTAQDIPSLLRSVPGIHVTDLTGNRRSYRVDLRGFGETAQSNTLVLIDGRRVNQPDLNGVDWYQIPLNRVRRIEVIRGGQATVLYGDNSGAGVINIITKGGTDSEGKAATRAGSYSSFSTNGHLRDRTGNLEYAVNGNLYRSDGYRENSDTGGGDAGGSLLFRASQKMHLGFSAGYHSDKTGLPGALKESELEGGLSREDSMNPDDQAEVDDYYFQISPQMLFFENASLDIDLSFRRREAGFFSSFFGGTFQGDTSIDTFAFSPRLVLGRSMGTWPNQFTFGFDWTDSEEDILNTTNFGDLVSRGDFRLGKRNWGIYLHEEFFPSERLAFSGGYRYDRVRYRFTLSVPEERDYDVNMGTFGLNFRPLKDSHLYFSYSRSFRYPVLDELFNFFSNTINDKLHPQTTNDVEVGLRHYFSSPVFANLNYLYLQSYNEIFFNPTGGPFGFGENENFDGKTRRSGIESSLGAQIGQVTLIGSYTFVSAEVLEGPLEGNKIPSVPWHKASVESTIYLDPRLTLSLEGSYIGTRPFESDWPNRFGDQEDYFLLNSRLAYTLHPLRFNLDLNNLLNREYSEFGVLGGFPVERAFYPSPKFNVHVGIRFVFN